jgi:hypothetical protein
MTPRTKGRPPIFARSALFTESALSESRIELMLEDSDLPLRLDPERLGLSFRVALEAQKQQLGERDIAKVVSHIPEP